MKNMKKRRLLSLFLAMVFILCILTGCGDAEGPGGGEDQQNTPTTTDTPDTPDAKDPSEPGDSTAPPEIEKTGEITYPVETNGKKLTIWCPLNANQARHMDSLNDHEILQEVSRRTGIEVEFIHPATGQEAEQLNLLVTGGELPDILIIRGLYNGGAASGVDEGLFMDLTDKMAQYAPDYYKAITSSENIYRLATTNENKIVDFALLKQTAPEFNRVNILTETVEKYGLDKMPETIADYESLFARMAADGMAGICIAKNGRAEQFMWPYGIGNSYYLDENGEVQFGPYTQAYKDYLTMMHDWYEKGYIHKDFNSSLNDTKRMNMFLNNQVGVIVTSCDQAYSSASAVDKHVQVANYPRLYEGQPMHFQTVFWDARPSFDAPQSTVINAKSENWELAMAYLNYFYTEEGATLCNWGIEGKHYTVDDNGVKHYTDYMLNNPDVPLVDVSASLKLHLWPKLAEPDVVCNPITTTSEEAMALRTMYSDDPTVDSSQTLPNFIMDIEASNARGKIQADIATYVDEMTVKFITGATPLSEFDNYLKTLESLNIQEALKITRDQYAKFLSKQIPNIG